MFLLDFPYSVHVLLSYVCERFFQKIGLRKASREVQGTHVSFDMSDVAYRLNSPITEILKKKINKYFIAINVRKIFIHQ